MTQDQLTVLGILLGTVVMFLWGKWRHDMVALGALLACVITGLVSQEQAFTGFAHPAVITVACVLILSRGLQTSGAVDALTRKVLPAKAGITLSLAALVGVAALLSGIMNNVGAMALLMPVAVQMARRLELPPGQILMPLAFGTILGGMTTLIGTPPNLIVAGFRQQAGLESFSMFDFTPVGLAVAVAGVIFVVLLGWRLVPGRKQSGVEGFESGAYVTETRVEQGSKAEGMSLRDVQKVLDGDDAQVLALVRHEMRMTAPNPYRTVRAKDILVIEAETEALSNVLSGLGLKLEEAKDTRSEEEQHSESEHGEGSEKREHAADEKAKASRNIEHDDGLDPDSREDEDSTQDSEIVLSELVVLPGSPLSGRSASELLLRTRYGLNLLALSRQGHRSIKRLRQTALKSGDMLLMQGSKEAIGEFGADNSCVPLAERELSIPDTKKAWQASLIMLFAVGAAAFGLLPAAVTFTLGVLVSMALRTVPPRAVYQYVDWPVIVLLAALIPVAEAMESTGAAGLIAAFLLNSVALGDAVVGLILIMVVTMFLSDLMNNAATAAMMCPIALGTASALGVSADSFLMAVAIGASCAFLTPIGHQNNTMILGPGGFRFGDYWRMGLPLEALVVIVSIPMLLWIWPL
ncbi:SLC13 family permease [Lacimicrobium alkaliphilum]|uniref:SLC13 family permease n=1 Tax=Lacimicrobium alkaliphilum TaxID=1526571 RepID=A0ABQ1RNT2_9ALTE|nr:SLC13 family permease [Lacimicrobium alkaliphilum]GGD74505.1 SLC13 family permease [Lacimicrobium alkaliphilum]